MIVGKTGNGSNITLFLPLTLSLSLFLPPSLSFFISPLTLYIYIYIKYENKNVYYVQSEMYIYKYTYISIYVYVRVCVFSAPPFLGNLSYPIEITCAQSFVKTLNATKQMMMTEKWCYHLVQVMKEGTSEQRDILPTPLRD